MGEVSRFLKRIEKHGLVHYKYYMIAPLGLLLLGIALLFCETSKGAPLFITDPWLDAVQPTCQTDDYDALYENTSPKLEDVKAKIWFNNLTMVSEERIANVQEAAFNVISQRVPGEKNLNWLCAC